MRPGLGASCDSAKRRKFTVVHSQRRHDDGRKLVTSFALPDILHCARIAFRWLAALCGRRVWLITINLGLRLDVYEQMSLQAFVWVRDIKDTKVSTSTGVN